MLSKEIGLEYFVIIIPQYVYICQVNLDDFVFLSQ